MSTETVKKTKAPAKPRKTTAKAKTTKTTETTLPPIAIPSHEDIAILAQRFWIERGCQDGEAEQDWLRAEAQLMAQAS
jgi:hypothetical protein